MSNLALMEGEFPEILKPAKVVPTCKKKCKVDCNNIDPIL